MSLNASAKPWPPPPDLDSIQELVAVADVEGFIEEGAPADEYETEAELLFLAVENFPTADLTEGQLVPIIEDIWQKSFSLDAHSLAIRGPGICRLARDIARFFGPEAQPQTRSRPL